MALLGWELKKIWRPGLLLAIVILGVIFYPIRPGFCLEYFEGSWEAPFALSVDWLERYGTTMEPEERQELDGQLEQLKAEFAQQLSEIPGAADAGITDYESFLAWDTDYLDRLGSGEDTTEEEANLSRAMDRGTNPDAIQALQEFMDIYDHLAAGGSAADYIDDVEGDTPIKRAKRQRTAEMQAEGIYGLLPSAVIDSTDEFFHYFSIWCVFSVVLLLSPTLVRDRLRRTRAMQWTSRRGRKVLNVQMGATLLSGVLLTLINYAVYLGPFLSTGALQFWDCPLVTVWLTSNPWFDWTYGQYVLVLLGLTLVLALAASGFTVVLSQFSSSYVAMLLKGIPLIFVLCWGLVPWLVKGAGRFSNRAVQLIGAPGTEFACGALAAVLAVGLCIWTCARQRRRDLTG